MTNQKNRNVTAIGEKGIAEKGSVQNLTSSPPMTKQKKGNGTAKLLRGFDDVIKPLLNCEFFDGNWVRDESYPLYEPSSCTLIDEQFNCFFNRRPDDGYYKLKWKPKDCTLPRLLQGRIFYRNIVVHCDLEPKNLLLRNMGLS